VLLHLLASHGRPRGEAVGDGQELCSGLDHVEEVVDWGPVVREPPGAERAERAKLGRRPVLEPDLELLVVVELTVPGPNLELPHEGEAVPEQVDPALDQDTVARGADGLLAELAEDRPGGAERELPGFDTRRPEHLVQPPLGLAYLDHWPWSTTEPTIGRRPPDPDAAPSGVPADA
jgi:hypothetical protein